MRRIAVIAASFLLACMPAPSPETSPAPVVAPREPPTITDDELRRQLFTFASDSFRGREAGTPDELRAANFLVDRLRQIGVEPAGDSGYFHRVPLHRQRFGPQTRLRVVAQGGSTDIAIGTGLLPLLTVGPGAEPRRRAEGDIVFAGYGVSMPGVGRNDLANLDVTNKVVVVINDAPPGADSAQRSQLNSAQAMAQRLQQFVGMQPAAIIILLTGEFADEFEGTYVPGLISQMSATPPAQVTDAQRMLPMILIGRRPGAASPLLPAGWPADDRAQPLTGRRLEAVLDVVNERVTSYNVVGRVRGSDSRLANSYVAFGAHYDHIGVVPPSGGDSIANGADDDGSGSVALLAIARMFQNMSPRPRRSMLFVWHTAEEKGLLGSAHFVQQPTVPLDSIVAMVNADMIGRNHPDSIYIVGPGAAPNEQSRVLGTVVDSVNAASRRPFLVNREWDSPDHPERIYYRSDHYSYAERGVPVVFFTTGLHEDYHRVSDTADKVDYAKLRRVSELFVEIGTALGNRPTRPR
ncbi:MAG TPA: M20/M25/M40 family metallo-hydrolase [Gemmatimonadaceae bacterium]|nr:M20/M25/M40 family metallo-hydrolase [Gemmatimonadaceae bacterium]